MDIVVGKKDGFCDKIAAKLGAQFLEAQTRVFKDGELKTTIAGDVRGKKVLYASRMNSFPGFNSNNYFVETIFALSTLRDAGAKTISVLMPYLAYGKQDKAFLPGESQSLKYFFESMKNAGASQLYTVIAHPCKHGDELRIFPPLKCVNIDVLNDLAEYVKKNFHPQNPFVIGPDLKASGWAGAVARSLGADSAALEKARDKKTGEISCETEVDVHGKDVIIVDDMINAGGTMLKAIEICKKTSPRRIICVAVHMIGADNCIQKIRGAGAELAAANTIDSPVSVIDVTDKIASEVRE